MTRELRQYTGDELPLALRAALSGSGPAVFAGDGATGLPATVPARVALVVQSSGSSASPKRIALSADALLSNAAASASALGGQGQWLLALPTSYIAGINVLVRSMAAETEFAAVPPSFSAAAFVEAALTLDQPLRFTSLVPAQLARLLDEPAAHMVLRRFDRILLGGQATRVAVLARAAELGLAVTRTYGSAETCGGCVYDGVPIGSTEVRVVDSEIELSGPNLAEGYLDADLTAARFYAEAGKRWYRTGDLGELVDGVLSVTGRLDDVIISGGVKVSLGEIERVVQSLVADAVVVAVDDERWGQVPVVVTTQAAQLAELRAAVREALGAAAAPARVVVVANIPLLESGKPDRLAIRAALPR